MLNLKRWTTESFDGGFVYHMGLLLPENSLLISDTHTHPPEVRASHPPWGNFIIRSGNLPRTTSPLQCEAVIATTVQWYAKCRATTKKTYISDHSRWDWVLPCSLLRQRYTPIWPETLDGHCVCIIHSHTNITPQCFGCWCFYSIHDREMTSEVGEKMSFVIFSFYRVLFKFNTSIKLWTV